MGHNNKKIHPNIVRKFKIYLVTANHQLNIRNGKDAILGVDRNGSNKGL